MHRFAEMAGPDRMWQTGLMKRYLRGRHSTTGFFKGLFLDITSTQWISFPALSR